MHTNIDGEHVLRGKITLFSDLELSPNPNNLSANTPHRFFKPYLLDYGCNPEYLRLHIKGGQRTHPDIWSLTER